MTHPRLDCGRPNAEKGRAGGASRFLLVLALGVMAVVSTVGITWGLPSRAYDRFLFPDAEVWPGDRIYRLARAEAKLAADRARSIGADVDVDALDRPIDGSVPLNAGDEDVARILLRYRLYTYQPDEMITMMALAGMRPKQLDFDPRLYQYGGLFIYPVGALIKLCGVLGLIEVRGDVEYYLDHPDEFGKLYIVARLYSAAWGMLGVLLVYGIARRLAGGVQNGESRMPTGEKGGPVDVPVRFALLDPPFSITAGLLAAVLFILLPVVVCMSHEAKPHLPGAVLMLAAVWLAIRHAEGRVELGAETSSPLLLGQQAEKARPCRGRDFWQMCICCGAAVGMVLSSAPLLILIPLTAIVAPARSQAGSGARRLGGVLTTTAVGVAIAASVYLLTNPYIAINAISNRAVLKSNFGNSLAMYEIARLGEGFSRVIELTVEGATLPVVVLGSLALFLALLWRSRPALLLIVPAGVFFLQFVLIGAAKPGEYGRFGIFTNAALAIGAACVIASQVERRRPAACLAAILTVGWVGFCGTGYLRNFRLDATGRGSRVAWAFEIAERTANGGPGEWTVALAAEPAPYNCPPLDFRKISLQLIRSTDAFPLPGGNPQALIYPADLLPAGPSPSTAGGWARETPISWANKPFAVRIVE